MYGKTDQTHTLSDTGQTRTIPVIHSNRTIDRLRKESKEALLFGADQISLVSASMEMIQSYTRNAVI